MSAKRKQKSKARKSKQAVMLSDIENLDIMLGSNCFERERANLAIQSEGQKS